MQRQEISHFIKNIHKSHEHWLEHGKRILFNNEFDKIDEPIDHENSYLGKWHIINKKHIEKIKSLKKLHKTHRKFHRAYYALYYDSMRKFDHGMTDQLMMDQLIKRFETLEQLSEAFPTQLIEVEDVLYKLSNKELDQLMTVSMTEIKHIPQLQAQVLNTDLIQQIINENDKSKASHLTISSENNTDDISPATSFNHKLVKDSQDMQPINIKEYDINQKQNPFDELEVLNRVKTLTGNDVHKRDKNEKVSEIIKQARDIKQMQKRIKIKNEDVLLEKTENTNRLITLKEQQIIQLNEEKEFSALELSHIENTQALVQKSIEQLEKYFILKYQEIEAEQKDNDNFIDFKLNTKSKIEKELSEIQKNQNTLKTKIQDLEQKALEDQNRLEESAKVGVIEQQFEELKRNKSDSLNELIESKKTQENDLAKLKEQVLLAEKTIIELDENIERQQQDMLDLEEKESIKNQQRDSEKQEIEKGQKARTEAINKLQGQCDQLADDLHVKQCEIDTLDLQIEELNKNNGQIESVNSTELEELAKQQEIKQEKVAETEKLKKSKQAEMTEIDIKIERIQQSLDTLKSKNTENAIHKNETSLAD